jgi:AAA+ ATPase superfamily predicted ATPase
MIELGKNDMLEKFILKNYEQYSGHILERYFRDMIAESEDITDIGNYWDNKGENEIDLIALNRFDGKTLIAEVKRNPNKINIARLYEKVASIQKQLSHYTLDIKGLSLQDM